MAIILTPSRLDCARTPARTRLTRPEAGET
jgi:hypothetical protein